MEKVLEIDDQIRLSHCDWVYFPDEMSLESDELGGCYSCTGPSLQIDISKEKAQEIISFLKPFAEEE